MKYVLIKSNIGKNWALLIDNIEDFKKFANDRANDFTEAYLMAKNSVRKRGEVSHCGVVPSVIAMELEKHENRETFVDDVIIYTQRFLDPYIKLFNSEGSIIVWQNNLSNRRWSKQKYAGFMATSWLQHIDCEIVETRETDVLEFPSDNRTYSNKDISITQWEDGRHYYAKVGDLDVEYNGKRKWNTWDAAKNAAEYFIKEINDKNK